MLIGTSCMFSDFFCAVTTISSRPPVSVSVAACDIGIPPARIAEMAEASGA